jgi:excisionase family DNA binding protein
LQRLVKAKDIRAVPIGKRTVRFRLEDLLEYIERQRGKL